MVGGDDEGGGAAWARGQAGEVVEAEAGVAPGARGCGRRPWCRGRGRAVAARGERG